MARSNNAWRRLREGTEGPNVTVSLPREWAEELLQSLMTSLEMDDFGDGDDDEDLLGTHSEPDEDELGGPSDSDEDDELDFAAGDDDDDDDEDDDDDDDEDDEDNEGSDLNTRPQTALGESAFSKLAGKLAHQKGVTNPKALAASIGRNKYGANGMARKAAAGRRK